MHGRLEPRASETEAVPLIGHKLRSHYVLFCAVIGPGLFAPMLTRGLMRRRPFPRLCAVLAAWGVLVAPWAGMDVFGSGGSLLRRLTAFCMGTAFRLNLAFVWNRSGSVRSCWALASATRPPTFRLSVLLRPSTSGFAWAVPQSELRGSAADLHCRFC